MGGPAEVLRLFNHHNNQASPIVLLRDPFGDRFVVGEYTATTSYYFLLLLASPARVQTL